MSAIASPRTGADKTAFTEIVTPPAEPVAPQQVTVSVNPLLYVTVGFVLLLPMQFGWSISQLNLSTFHNQDDCNARPVANGKCLMFPGHSNGDWTWVVNLWTVGGMIGSLGCGRISDAVGRKRALMLTALIMIIGGAIQASAQRVGVFALGRFVAGIASGASTALPNGYINEVSPPQLRNRLGVTFQIAVGFGIVLVGLTFFFLNTSSGWRYIGGFPIVLASLFLLGSTHFVVESPVWLLNKGRREDAEVELARLFGAENVKTALSWMSVPEAEAEASKQEEGRATHASGTDASATGDETNPWKALFSPAFRQQTIIAIVVAVCQQLSGINAVFFYSSDLFKDAGLSDDRIGSIIVNIVNLLPTLGAGALGTKFGNRGMMIFGHGLMLTAAVGITISLVIEVAWLSIAFTALYVFAFAVSLGPLVFVIVTSLFPDSLRASGTSICLFANWVGTLIVGVGYPHVANALGHWGFLPFIVTLTGFGLFMVKFLPETAGLTSDEIQEIFRSKQKNAELQ